MKLRTKRGHVYFTVVDKSTGEKQFVDPADYLASWQHRKMAGMPHLIWQFAQILKKEYAAKGQDVAVYAESLASLNSREEQPLVDPYVDLASEPRPVFRRAKWIVPLEKPLLLKGRGDEQAQHDHDEENDDSKE
jgi:hypothetical protein